MKHPYEVGMAAASASGGRGYGQGSRGEAHKCDPHCGRSLERAAVTTCSHHSPRGDARVGGRAWAHQAEGNQRLVQRGQGEG